MTIITRASSKTAGKTAAKPGSKTAVNRGNKEEVQTVDIKESAESAPLFAETTAATEADQPVQPMTVPIEGVDQPITGRGVFAVRTLGQAVSVENAFLAEDGNVLRLPSVFPNREYAMNQIDELRALVNRHFDELAGKN